MKTKQWEQPIDAEGNPVEEAAVDATNELVAATTRNEDLFLVIALNDLAPSPTNPRRHFDESTLAELAGSVKTRGIIQPIVVRPAGLKFEIVAGERRYRAAQLAGLTEAPCIVRELSDGDVLEIQVIENAQRDDVHPLEECEGFRRILDSGIYGTGQEAIKTLASKISMSPSHVYARLKLVDLSKDAQAEFLAGNISMGHAIQIARLDPVGQMKAITATLWENRYNGAALADRGARKESPLSVRDLAYWIAREITRDLSKAPWDRLDAQLLPQAGSCAACPKQTGVENLLGESEGDSRCLDPGCFKAKEQAFTALKLKESIAANPGAEKISTKHYDTSKNLLSPASYSIVKKETPGAVPAIIAETGDHDSEKVGEIAYIRLFRTSSSGQKIPPIEERRERLEELRLQRAENLARFRIYEACLAAIETGAGDGLVSGPLADLLLYKAAARSSYQIAGAKYRGPSSSDVWTCIDPGYEALGAPRRPLPCEGRTLIKASFMTVCMDEIAYHDNLRPEANCLLAFAAALAIDVEGIRAQADFDCLSQKEQAARKSVQTSANPVTKNQLAMPVDPPERPEDEEDEGELEREDEDQEAEDKNRTVIDREETLEEEQEAAAEKVEVPNEHEAWRSRAAAETKDEKPAKHFRLIVTWEGAGEDVSLLSAAAGDVSKTTMEALIPLGSAKTLAGTPKKASYARGTIAADGNLFVVVGIIYHAKTHEVSLCRVVAAEAWVGPTFTYDQLHTGVYRGLAFTCHGCDYVCSGERVKLTCSETATAPKETVEA